MAQPATNPKIEELRFKLKTDPRSRLFYQLAEELRKGGQFAESELVLRSGLAVYPAYLAAWVSLGRVLREQKKDNDAVDALSKALQLDPGNMVAARLLADAYLALGEKVEAIKKYKLVHALLPSDEELEAHIAELEREINPPSAPAPVVEEPAEPEPAFVAPMEESPFDKTVPPFAEAAKSAGEEMRMEDATGDSEPMAFAHEESPFEEPAAGFSAAAVEIEAPSGIHIASAPLTAEVPAAPASLEELPPVEASPIEPEAAGEDIASTVTMADLYARQGLVEDARHIYEDILARDPSNSEARGGLESIAPRTNPRIARLEQWLAKVGKREVERV